MAWPFYTPAELGFSYKSAVNAPYSADWHWQGETNVLPGTKRDWSKDSGELWRNSAVAICLSYIQRTFPEARFRVVTEDAEGNERAVPGHELVALLRRPNKWQSGFHLWQATALSYWTDGNAYWLKERSSYNKVTRLFYLPHWQVRPVSLGADFLTHYEYQPAGGKRKVIVPVEDIVHFKYGLDPTDQRRGMAPLKQVVRSVVADNEADTYTAAILMNMGVAPVLLQPRQWVDSDRGAEEVEVDEGVVAKIKRIFKQVTTGDKRGEPLVPTFPMDIQKLGMTPEELALKVIREVPEARICAAMGVSAMVVGLTSAEGTKTYANFSEANQAFYQFTIMPVQEHMAQELDAQLLLPDFPGSEGQRCDWDYSDVKALQQDQDAVAKRAALLYQAGVVKRKEARGMVGETFDDAEDDVYLVEPQPAMPAPGGEPGAGMAQTDQQDTAAAV